MKFKEKYIQITMVIFTLVMTVLRFLLNEKGRITPDSIRFMRSAHVFPEIDNTTTPLGYILGIKVFTLVGFDEFWSSKIIGVLSFLGIIFLAKKFSFFLRESILTCSLFAFVSIFAATLSETLALFSLFMLFWISREIISDQWSKTKAIIYLSLSLILLFNIRYSGLFIIGSSGLFGLLSLKKSYGKTFVISAVFAFLYVVFYKLLFINHFNESYVERFLEIGLKPSSQLFIELLQGLATSFNPFIHMKNPAGGIINVAIYGLGALNIAVITFLFLKNSLSELEKYMILCGVSGIFCSFIIQYFYSIDPLDYRLLSMFTFPVWLVYFRKLFNYFNTKIYFIGFLSLLSGFAFTWLSKGNYLRNRAQASQFLKEEKLDKIPVKFYVRDEADLDVVNLAELLSTVNPHLNYTFKPSDTLSRTTLTQYKVLQKIKIQKNKYQ